MSHSQQPAPVDKAMLAKCAEVLARARRHAFDDLDDTQTTYHAAQADVVVAMARLIDAVDAAADLDTDRFRRPRSPRRTRASRSGSGRNRSRRPRASRRNAAPLPPLPGCWPMPARR
jgi:hypothetical protein